MTKNSTRPTIIFIIGFPRSGTKVLLELLKTHPKIGGSNYEINLAHFLTKSNVIDKGEFEKLVLKSTLSVNANSNEIDLFFNQTRKSNENVSKQLYVDLLNYLNKDPDVDFIVDKSPRYIAYIEDLMELFTEAKFIHLIRNPVDVALSHKNVWNKSIIRTSCQWKKANEKLLKESLQGKILRITYEELTSTPSIITKRLSNFLEIPDQFEINDVYSGEKHGGIQGQGIEKNVKDSRLRYSYAKKVEEYTYHTMKAFGYEVSFAKGERKRNLFHKALLAIWDKTNVLIFHMKEKGILKGIRYYWKLKY